jgi:hypothetical protein
MQIVQGLVLVTVLVLAGLSTTQAQRNPLVGTWSTPTSTTQGQHTGTIFTTFYADGRFTQRWVIPRGTVDYVGSYRLSPDLNSLQWTYRDYSPKTDCRYGACYPVTPVVQMNTPFVTHLRWVRDNLFLTEDQGGTNRWIRQQ